MKTIFTFLSSLALATTLFAAEQRHESSLIIRSEDRYELRVVIDGRRFQPRDNYMRIRNIDPGYHNVKIYRQRRSGLRSFGGRYELIYNSNLRLRPSGTMFISIDRYGRVSVRERRSYRDDRDWRDNGRYGEDRPYRSERDRDDDRDWDRENDFDFGEGGHGRDRGNDREVIWDEDRDGPDYRAMSDREFSRVLESIQKEWYEGNKQKSATQVIRNHYFTASQVRQMLQLFSFENTKLELAKLAYANTVDRNNYHVVNDVFSYSSSRQELASYIRNFR